MAKPNAANAAGAQSAPEQSQQPQEPQMQYPRKITLKEIGAQPSKEDRAAMLLDHSKVIALARIYGIAGAFKPGMGTTPDGTQKPYVKFLGQFRAINLKTGEVFNSSTMILPQFIEEQLHGILSAGGAQSVEFAVEISAQGDKPGAKPSATGYTYSVKPLLQMGENSALAALEAKFSNVAKLPAPGK